MKTKSNELEVRERPAFRVSGWGMVLLLLLAALAAAGLAAAGHLLVAGLLGILIVLLLPGFFILQPNEAVVLTFFGRYVGSVREDGFWWTNPFASRRRLSLRIQNFNTEVLKVNDRHGNPIEIAAVVVWRVQDTAKAAFDVEDYPTFVRVQVETAIRAIASRYPYDAEEPEVSLRGSPEVVAQELKEEVQRRLRVAGVEVLEARISHLAYAPEIAQAMLRRQQAQAVVAARRLIVEAAVGMVKEALDRLVQEEVVELDEEKKAAMVNNLMVALTSEQPTAPVVNVGSLYT